MAFAPVAFDALLKKYFAAVILGLVALAAYFQAAGATQLIGAALEPPPAAPGTSARLGTSSLTGSSAFPERKDAEPIISRNPFDSVTGPLNAKPVEPLSTGPTQVEVTDPLSAPACEGIAAFIITESTDPNWSVAALQGGGDAHPRMRRVGDDVGGKQVEFIGFNQREMSPAVWLSSGGSLCQILLFKVQATPAAAPAPAPAAATPEPPPAAPSRSGAPALPADIASKIQKVSDTEFNIDRGVVDKILENQAELMRSARIVPEQKDGKVVGVRMFGIRPDTLLGTLGMQNGDRLESINGFNMASPEKALEAYARLRTASNLNVKVNRRGSPVSIDYRIK
jgi:general secretion pathway protein C